MGAAFEVNKQMCDLEIDRERWEKIGKEWASKKKEIVESIFGNITIKKSNIMGKKTKKMTKAEVFEYLKGKKVSVANREINDKVQSKLFACGVEWKHHGTDVCYYGDYLVINPEGFLCHCGGMGKDYWNRLFHEEISSDDILSIEIVDGTPKFSYKKVVELAKPLMEYLNDTGCSERICVTYESIVAEPMATFLHGEMKGC